MAGISKVLETELNGLKVNLFEFDIENEESFNEIKAYLVNKVKISKNYNNEEILKTIIIPYCSLYCCSWEVME